MTRRRRSGLEWLLNRPRVHYAGGTLAACGRTVGFHAARPFTLDPAKVTCRACRRTAWYRKAAG